MYSYVQHRFIQKQKMELESTQRYTLQIKTHFKSTYYVLEKHLKPSTLRLIFVLYFAVFPTNKLIRLFLMGNVLYYAMLYRLLLCTFLFLYVFNVILLCFKYINVYFDNGFLCFDVMYLSS